MGWPLCKYRDVAGMPRRGFHATRIPVLDVALWDVVGTILLAAALASGGGLKRLLMMVVALLLVSIAVHFAFCVETRVTNILLRRT